MDGHALSYMMAPPAVSLMPFPHVYPYPTPVSLCTRELGFAHIRRHDIIPNF